MTFRFALISTASVALLACGATPEKSPPVGTEATALAFDPPPPAAGYTRIVAPVMKGLEPGADQMYCQYVHAPFDHDVDVLDVGGYQSKYGHHVVAYGTTQTVALGTSRPCNGEDNLAAGFLGGVGGEAGGAVKLPDGVAFRLSAGSAIMLNTHFMNLGTETVDGQSVIDFKFADSDGSRTVAAMLANVTVGFTVPPMGSAIADAACTVPRDLKLILFANHMHNFGSSTFTDHTPPAGAAQMVRDDATWSAEMQFNPVFAKWDAATPLTVHQGETLHTHCEWQNTSDKPLSFPDEMCVGIGFFLTDVPTAPVCFNGTWRE